MPSSPIRVKMLGHACLRQLPPACHGGGAFAFTADPACRDYDWLVVYDDFPGLKQEVLACPRGRTVLVTAEPSSIKIYGRAYLRQFGHIISSQPPRFMRHAGHEWTQPGLWWFYGMQRQEVDFAYLQNHVPQDKTAVISTVCSNKRQRHTLHHLRFNFTRRIKAGLPELEIYGHGVRPMADKSEALDAYRYHIAVENHIGPHHWTEKLADAFLGCTLPFYAGAPNVFDYFPKEALVPIDMRRPDEALASMRQAIAENWWARRLPAILEARRLVLEKYNLFPWLAQRMTLWGGLDKAASGANETLLCRKLSAKAHPGLRALDVAEKSAVQGFHFVRHLTCL